MFLFLGLYLQIIKAYTPVQAGFAFLPFSVGHHPRRRDRRQPDAQGGPAPADGPRLLVVAAAGMFLAHPLDPGVGLHDPGPAADARS